MSSCRPAVWAPLLAPPFLVCVAVLAGAAIIAGPVAGHFSRALIKEPIYCRKPLHEMRKDAFGPYEFRQATQLKAAFIASLGTDHYVSWVLEDTRTEQASPLRFATVFVTYYTGTANLVPHSPDVCFKGAGYEPKQPHENMTLDVPTLAPDDTQVPVRVCTFRKSKLLDSDEPTVVYTFHCNGGFVASSYTVRRWINNPLAKHAYFSKVEVSFGSATNRDPSREQSIEAARELFEHLLPVLVKEHYPDWESAEGNAQAE